MRQLDPLFFKVFQHYKVRFKAKANNIALFYILLLQSSIVLLIGTALMLFLNQMQVNLLSVSKARTLYIMLVFILMFRNWIYYTGKKRKVLNSKSDRHASISDNILLLWLIPTSCVILACILLQRL